ncbi:hypothetical protein CDN98_21415 [Roseateles terrae]|nr:hypothetical protein CDN98_21415 [Roseateles terrae]
MGRVAGDALLPVLTAAGDDLPGAVSLRDTQAPRRAGPQLRVIPVTEMAERLRGPVEESLLLPSNDAPQVMPWWPSGSAGRPRVGVYLDQGQWWWTRTPQLASTHLLEAPSHGAGEGEGEGEGEGDGGEHRLFNRFFCLRLAARLGLDVAPVELLRLPMPVLQFQRWDRLRLDDGRVRRFHAVSVAQALGLRPHAHACGDIADRECHASSASAEAVPTASAAERWKQLGKLLDLSPQPLVDRRALIRWWIFQTLTGHWAARPDELWCYLDHAGLRWAPVMDLICPPALNARPRLTPESSMVPPSGSAHDWAVAAKSCGAPPRILAHELRRMCEAAPQEAHALAETLADEMPQDVMQGIVTVVSANATRHLAWVDDLLHTDHRD